MAPSLLHPPSYLAPASALQLSQSAPVILKNSPKEIGSNPLLAVFAAPESADLWLIYENLLLSCLRTGDEQSAYQCLERLSNRFGEENERVMAFRGLIQEAVAVHPGELEDILKSYDAILADNNTNIPIIKRRITLLRSLGRVPEAISASVALLDFSPTDAEAWSELAELYFSHGMYAQAIYSLEEVLVLAPNAWNIHARLGEMQYAAAGPISNGDGSNAKYLAEALKRFCRSIELCDDYLRGFYGLHLVTSRLLSGSNKVGKGIEAEDFVVPDRTTIERLKQRSTEKLGEIVRRNAAKEPKWSGYEESEVAAARQLLDKESMETVR